jgi:hypothetical protein
MGVDWLRDILGPEDERALSTLCITFLCRYVLYFDVLHFEAKSVAFVLVVFSVG